LADDAARRLNDCTSPACWPWWRLIGLDIDVNRIGANIGPILWAIAAVLISRAVVVYGLSWIVHRINRAMPTPYRHVLFWGGLRGAISNRQDSSEEKTAPKAA
jgi:hypothetical protein